MRDIETLTKGFPSNIKVSWDAPLDLPSVHGDAVTLSRALLNLCTNARHALPDGGTIHLEADLVDGSALNTGGGVVASKEPSGNSPTVQYLRLRIKDSGVGVSEDMLLRIFTPGFTTRPERQGQGLGLSSTMGIIEKHNGFVTVTSKLGEGTEFSVFLPTTGGSLADPIPNFGPNSVVMADDDRSQRLMLRSAVGRTGANAVPLSSGNAAVAAVRAHPDHVKAVFLDRNMPGFTLPETMGELKAINPALRIIVITADDVRAIPGAHRVLAKPISFDQIQQILAEP